jgi:hypothetical protein
MYVMFHFIPRRMIHIELRVTWSPTQSWEQMLRVFENKMPRRIFGSKRQEVKEGWRNLYMYIINKQTKANDNGGTRSMHERQNCRWKINYKGPLRGPG